MADKKLIASSKPNSKEFIAKPRKQSSRWFIADKKLMAHGSLLIANSNIAHR